MLISDRSKEIIEYLMNAAGPLTVSDLAKELQVTERTIYRQMPEVTKNHRVFWPDFGSFIWQGHDDFWISL